ncbi:GH15 family glucan-1,4-alpha-glucosidase [Palleronia aestuarii]|uniref:Trehalase n=1 Tax=Palleronia aestuarii TaxID=568105 RepID=A0A2W7NAP7_9RHOB|nr:glycoside hydrolase family 15 protein [Palleronia aestuarii]PZX17070.1 GH15 family glucan-1,4-alpha-glucosidase [Palleronia aestuarii]
MSAKIEDYGFIGNMLSCALVSRDGSIDWLCLPRFDSDACFAALLGTEENGRWQIAPEGEILKTHRRYRPGTTILETTFETAEGAVTIIDFMPLSGDAQLVDLIRIVRCDRGRVRMKMDLALRFGYGRRIPWVRKTDSGLQAVAGPDAVEFRAPVALEGEDMRTGASFEIGEGAELPFVLSWHPSHRPDGHIWDPGARLSETEAWWRDWSAQCTVGEDDAHPWPDAVARSLLTLKALTFRPTGGIVAAPTTSLPERIGGGRNWDYRYCWVRDASLTLLALLNSGYRSEAAEWRQWLLRATSGHPRQMQIMYGLSGEQRLTEIELPWLSGYEASAPVRLGNAAQDQLQIDVYGELMEALHVGRCFMLEPSEASWSFQRLLLEELDTRWRDPDEGIWEVRGEARHFTHSRVMAWVAFDRGIRAVEDYGLDGPVDRWRATREEIRDDILAHGWNEERGSFVQYYGGTGLDAALLLLPAVGFLPPDDHRIVATVEAIQRDLVEDGLVLRYRSEGASDGLEGREGTFLVCSFWLVDALVMIGRLDEAETLFEHLLSLRNDLGLLAEEYDPVAARQLGNFPQAFSHVGLVNSAHNILAARKSSSHHTG